MSGNVADSLIFKQKPPGWHVFALGECKQIAAKLKAKRLMTLAASAIELEQAALDTEFAWGARREPGAGLADKRRSVVKNKIARQLTSIRDIAYGRSDVDTDDDDDDEVSAAARDLLDACFPNGVDVIAKRPYEVFLGTLDTMIGRLQG